MLQKRTKQEDETMSNPKLIYYKVETAKNFNSLIEVNKLVNYVKENGMSAIGVADVQNMASVMDVYTLAQKQNLLPIISVQFRVYGVLSHDELYVTLVAKDYKGYIEILSLHNAIATKDEGKSQRLNLREIPELKNVVATVSITEAIKEERSILIDTILKGLKDRVGEKNLWIEIEPAFSEEEKEIQLKVVEQAKTSQLITIAAPTIRYFEQKQEKVLDVMQRARSKQKGMYNKGVTTQYFLSASEIDQAYEQAPTSVEQTLKLQQLCNVKMPVKGTKEYKKKMCRYKVPESFNVPFQLEEMFDVKKNFVLPQDEQSLREIGYLCHLAWEGLKVRYANDPEFPEIKKRLKHELGMTIADDEANYTLVIQGFIRRGREKGLTFGPGRGSVVGSMLAYCLDIIEIDSYKEGLLYERYKNEFREGDQDMDIDVAKSDRDAVLLDIQQEYGFYHMAKLSTFGTHGAKDALSAVGKLYSMPENLIVKLKQSMSKVKGVIEEVLNNETLLKEAKKEFEKLDEVLYIVQEIQHLPKSTSIHTAGIVLSEKDIRQELPITLQYDKDLGAYIPVIQYAEKNKHLEMLGFQKLDILPLIFLDVMKNTLISVKETKGIELKITEIPLDDPLAFELMGKGETLGLFQIGSDDMSRLAKSLMLRNHLDVKNLLGIYRPGAKDESDHFVENQKKNNQYIYDEDGNVIEGVDDIKAITNSTHGIIIYQEQIMRIAQIWAGYSLAEADVLRRAVSKKEMNILQEEREIFVRKAKAFGRDEETSNKLYDLIVKFEYGFNESHAVAYAKVTIQTAYLKANYPLEYMSALITAYMDESVSAAYYKDAKRMGIVMYPPSIESSGSAFVPYKDGIAFGLPIIKHVNIKAAKAIEEERAKRPFYNFTEFLNRVHSSVVDMKVIKALISVDALNIFGNQNQLFKMLEGKSSPMQIPSQQMLFADLPNMQYDLKEVKPNIEDVSKEEKIERQQEYTSLIFEKNPLEGNEKVYGRMLSRLNKTKPVFGGVIVDKDVVKTKTKKNMAYLRVQGSKKVVKVVVFDNVFEKVQTELGLYEYVLFKARYDESRNQYVLNQVEKVNGLKMLVTFPQKVINAGKDKQLAWLKSFNEILAKYPGSQEVVLTLKDAQKKYKATISDEFLEDLKQIVNTNEFALDPVR